MSDQPHTKGKVYLIGAGPGEPDLITVRGANILKEANVIVYDRLANPELLSITADDSEHIYVGKKPGKPSVSQPQINRILVTKAKEGKVVARLKGGDPFIFGRGGEECEALRSEQISYEVVPGISSAIAAPAYAGIPLTHRKAARSFTVITGHTVKGFEEEDNWQHVTHADTLVILMGMRNLSIIAATLIRFGRHPDTPVAVVEKATYSSQRSVTATLATIAEEVVKAGLSSPATIVVGELASLSNDLAWFVENQSSEVQDLADASPVLSKFAG